MREGRTIVEAVTPGATVSESANALSALLNLGRETGEELILLSEPHSRVQAGDLIFDGVHVHAVHLAPAGGTDLIRLEQQA